MALKCFNSALFLLNLLKFILDNFIRKVNIFLLLQMTRNFASKYSNKYLPLNIQFIRFGANFTSVIACLWKKWQIALKIVLKSISKQKIFQEDTVDWNSLQEMFKDISRLKLKEKFKIYSTRDVIIHHIHSFKEETFHTFFYARIYFVSAQQKEKLKKTEKFWVKEKEKQEKIKKWKTFCSFYKMYTFRTSKKGDMKSFLWEC